MLRLYEKAVAIGEIRLIIIDPVVNVVSGDSHKNGEVRRDLQPLVELGAKLKAIDSAKNAMENHYEGSMKTN